MKIGVPRELAANERRIAAIPDTVSRFVKAGAQVMVEKGAGAASCFMDDAFTQAGATLVDAQTVWGADLVVKVQPPTQDEAARMRDGACLVSHLQAWNSAELLGVLNAKKVSAFSLEQVPRTTRAQAMDVLSSQATIAGYKAVLMAAERAPRILPMLVTAAGTLTPATVLVLGAGVAGLSAIGTAKRLGAVVEAFDVRAAAAEQVESLGAKFIGKELLSKEGEGQGGYAKQLSQDAEERNRQLIAHHAKKALIVIATAAIPKRRAPLLVPKSVVETMQPGAVIVDLAAETGGNCELTKLGQDVVHQGVTILGPEKLAATVPTHASQMFARNVLAFVINMTKDGKLGEFALNFDDDIVQASCATHAGTTRSAP
jgi:NAD(P) transhydrogenase subunit alpha